MTAPVYNSIDRMLRQAYADAGYLQEGGTMTADQTSDGLQRLNDLINFHQTQGLKLWTNQDVPVTLVAGTATYTLTTSPGPKPLRIVDAYYLDVNDVRRPVKQISRQEYDRLSQTTSSGPVVSFFVDPQILSLIVKIWNTPDADAATGTLHLVRQEQLLNAVTINDTIGFPSEWYIGLRWFLADELATGQPQAIMDRCQQRAAYYKERLEGWDVDQADVTFSPDQGQGYHGGSFR